MPADRRRERREQRTLKHKIQGYTSEAKTAEQLNIGVRTLRKWRQLKIGPPWVEIGRQIYYPDESRAAWIKSRVVQPERTAVA